MKQYIPFIVIVVLIGIIMFQSYKLDNTIEKELIQKSKHSISILKLERQALIKQRDSLQNDISFIQSENQIILNKLDYEKTKVYKLQVQINTIRNRKYNRKYLDSLKSNVKY